MAFTFRSTTAPAGNRLTELPTTPIHDLVVKNDDLIVATHGRSFWILDGIHAVRQMTGSTAKRRCAPLPARQPRFAIPAEFPVAAYSACRSQSAHRRSHRLTTLKPTAKDAVSLEILDAKGKLIRKLSSKKAAKEATPDEQEFGVTAAAGACQPKPASIVSFGICARKIHPPFRRNHLGGKPQGPLVVPGSYQIKLTISGKSYTAPAEIQKDPRVSASQSDLEKQAEFAWHIRDRVSAGHDAVNQIRSVRTQLDALKKRLEADASAKPVLDAAEDLKKKMKRCRRKNNPAEIEDRRRRLNYPIPERRSVGGAAKLRGERGRLRPQPPLSSFSTN